MKNNLKKILLIGPYSPRRCGIASHIIQLESTLKNEGWLVDILSPHDCEGTYHENLIGWFNILKLYKYIKYYDVLNVHFTPEEYFFSGRNPLRIFNFVPLFSLCILFWLGKKVNYVIHEPPTTRFIFQRTILDKFVWSQVPQITFFTEKESKIFENKFNFKFNDDRVKIENVNLGFQKYSDLSKQDARHMLNISQKKIIFLCVGFIHEFKGFDRIALIFSKENYKNCELYIVGSIRLDNKRDVEYYSKLSEICNGVDNIHKIKEYLSYEDFDMWIIAADYIVFPYRRSSNSGVLGRAKLYNRTVIVSNIGGLSDQVGQEDIIFSSDVELTKIVSKIDVYNK